MPRHPELYQWIDTIVMRFPSLSKPQALGLALWMLFEQGLLCSRFFVPEPDSELDKIDLMY